MQLEFEALSKKYKSLVALNGVNCQLTAGIYGLLGPNGAGKSTLMKLLVQNIRPTAGRICMDGMDISKMGDTYKGILGYMPQQQGLFPFFTGRRFLNYMGLLKGMNKNELQEAIEIIAGKVNLLDVLDKKIGGYSGGMKQRLLIAQAFLGNPKIVVFDEPTAGLDPKERIHARNLIAENAEDKIILIATHVVQDIEYIANKVILLKKGEIVEIGSPETMQQQLEGKVWELTVDTAKAGEYMNQYLVSSAVRYGDNTKIRFLSEHAPNGDALNVKPDLEDVYLYVFGG
ncbi:MAG: ATP-binding cassette domain-containing protein [Clostridium sp.]|nr:ATP-binding cassette domain-containing protein [Clostridium sp.]MCM1171773.1 ATP-binding cassette domain-containing protein [Clostridium sp.]MCM1207971.1 ATP-binding cassette domain-containing protein [Ruminococcus sp.]